MTGGSATDRLPVPGTSRAGREQRAAVGVDELVRAWRAVQDGQFRRRGHPTAVRTRPPSSTAAGPADAVPVANERGWEPVEPVVVVVGCTEPTGASAVALALATAAGDSRVIDCAPPGVSGLVAASTAELGRPDPDWVRGRRDQVLLDRLTTDGPHRPAPSLGQLPLPADPGRLLALSVLDLGWDLIGVLGSRSWLSQQLTDQPPDTCRIVLVTAATVPGLRRLEHALTLLDPGTPGDGHGVAGSGGLAGVVVGPSRRRWPRETARALGPRTRALDASGRLLAAPLDPGLAVRGVDTTPLPARLLDTGCGLLGLLGLARTPTDPTAADRTTTDRSATDRTNGNNLEGLRG